MPSANLNWTIQTQWNINAERRDNAIWLYNPNTSNNESCNGGGSITLVATFYDPCAISVELPSTLYLEYFTESTFGGSVWYQCTVSKIYINGNEVSRCVVNRGNEYFTSFTNLGDSVSVSGGTVTIQIELGKITCRTSEGYNANYTRFVLPQSIDYNSSASAPSATTTIDTNNFIEDSGIRYYYKSTPSLNVTTVASGGCPKDYSYYTSVKQDNVLIGDSSNNTSLFTLDKCTFGNPYVVSSYVSNSTGASPANVYNVLIGSAPESLVLDNTVVYLPPNSQTKLYLSGKSYANDVSCSISADISDVVTYEITNKSINTETGTFQFEITLTGVFVNPYTYLNITVSDFYGATSAPQCYVQGGIDSSFTLMPRYPLVNEEVVFTNTSITGDDITYTWRINDTDPLATTDMWTARYSGINLIVVFKEAGIYSISLNTAYLDVFESTATIDVDVGKSVNTSEPSSRYKIIIANKDGNDYIIVGRTPLVANCGKCIYTNLKYEVKENESSQATFKLIGANTLQNSTSYYELINRGSKIFILDDNYVAWAGIITDVSESNTISPFSSSNTITYHDITCMDALYELMYSQYDTTAYTVTDTVQNILLGTDNFRGILPDESGGIIGYEEQSLDDLTQSVSFTFSNTDRNTLLTQLTSTTPWKYRSRPNVIEVKKECNVSNATITYESNNDIKAGDLIYVDVGGYEDGLYHRGVMIGEFNSNISSVTKTYTFDTRNVSNPLSNTVGYVTVIRKQSLYDVAPSFYQDSYIRRYTTDRDIYNVSNNVSINDKYGVVSVIARSIQGTNITSQMKGFMRINPDYSIPSAYVITKSIDSYIVNTNFISNINNQTVSTFDLKGWTVPTTITDLYDYEPRILYSTGDSFGYYEFSTIANTEGYINSVTRYIGGDSEKYSRVGFIEIWTSSSAPLSQRLGLGRGTFIIGNVYEFNTTNGLSIGDSILIGDEVVTISNIIGNRVQVDRINSKNPHGHMVGTLAYKVSSIDAPLQEDIEEGSPLDLYGDVIYTSYGPNGMTQMELERYTQNLLRFGSTYMDNGTATIPLIYFGKTERGIFSPFNAGDHISIQPSHTNPNTMTEFELIGYEVDTQKYMASVTYGMPTKTMADVLRGVSTNQMVTISNADYQ